MLRFHDNTQVRLTGLNEILEELYSEGRQASPETAGQIIDRLEARKNFIPSSDHTRREYASLLLTEYREYVEGRGGLGKE